MKIILILLVLATTVIFTGMFIRTTMSSVRATAPAFDHSNCQYPYRASNPLNGCDNTDPACPLEIKGGTCEGYNPTPKQLAPWVGSNNQAPAIVEQPVKANTVKHKTCKL